MLLTGILDFPMEKWRSFQHAYGVVQSRNQMYVLSFVCTCAVLAFGETLMRHELFILRSTCNVIFEFVPGDCNSGSGGYGESVA